MAQAVIVSAGGQGTPPILQRSGLSEAGQGFFADPLWFVSGPLDIQSSMYDIPMTAGINMAKDGIVMTDFNVPALMHTSLLAYSGIRGAASIPKLRKIRKLLSIMIKVRDGLHGRINLDETFSKPLDYETRHKLDKGAVIAEDILLRAGVKREEIMKTAVIAAHPGGTVRIGNLLDTNCQTPIGGCYCMDTSIIPEPWVMIEDSPNTFLEGPAFDRDGNLFVSSVFDGRVFKITPDKTISTIFNNPEIQVDGLAFHKDGRLFVACISGEVVAMNPDGSNLTIIKVKGPEKPLAANDLVFDSQGNLYVTDFAGNVANPAGGVYRISSDFTKVDPVVQNLAAANGIALAPEGNILWVSETARNALLRLELLPDGISLSHIVGATYPYYCTGYPGPDSMAMDVMGNVYQAFVFQGRVLILNRGGIPVAQVLVPGRDEGMHLGTTNVAFKPGTNEVVLTAFGQGGAWMYKFKGLAEGVKLFSHQ
ncbi:SMP-30/gluconolactonase/LRE family protein [Thermodesulfobacteriota bacterium]